MDTRICILSTNLAEGLQSYSERRLPFPWAVSGLAAERMLRLEEKQALCPAIPDVGKPWMSQAEIRKTA